MRIISGNKRKQPQSFDWVNVVNTAARNPPPPPPFAGTPLPYIFKKCLYPSERGTQMLDLCNAMPYRGCEC